MNFYGVAYLESQSNLINYVKYFFIFGSLIVLAVVFSLYLRHRIQTKYRDLSIIIFLFLLFVSGIQYSDYKNSQNASSQSSQMVGFVEQIAREKKVSRKKILVNSTQLTDNVIVRIDGDYYEVTLNSDQSSYALTRIYLMNTKININK